MSLPAGSPELLDPSLGDPTGGVPDRYGVNRGFAEEMLLRAALGHDVPAGWSDAAAPLRAAVAEALGDTASAISPSPAVSVSALGTGSLTDRDLAAHSLVRSFEDHGFLSADVDPLGVPLVPPTLEPRFYGLALTDEVAVDASGSLTATRHTVSDLLAQLRARWCGRVALEVSHLEPAQRELVRAAFLQSIVAPSADDLASMLTLLCGAEALESVLATRFLGVKRFGIEGSENLLVLLSGVFDELRSTSSGVELGMAHRGRFAVLTGLAGFPHQELFRLFEDRPDAVQSGAGDVKVHLGFDGSWPEHPEFKVRVAFNPSHLETVFPVVLGAARVSGRVPVVIHGDAAFSGQGVVAEALQMHRLEAYRCGGAVHVVLDNHLGFTTDPKDARSSRYASSPARLADIPIIRVNGASALDCLRAGRLAARLRALTGGDVCLHLLAWRSNGHNEGDDPTFTQPGLYRRLADLPTPRQAFLEHLDSIGAMTRADGEEFFASVRRRLLGISDQVRAALPQPLSTLPSVVVPSPAPPPPTGVSGHVIDELWQRLLDGPAAAGFPVQDKVGKAIASGRDADGSFSWAAGEALAYASLLESGLDVRLAGEDSRRGTFSHRHAVLNADDGARFERFDVFGPGRFTVYDSHLSEYAALAFEYGFDLTKGDGLTLWEAQFGDFLNGAQIVLDTCLANGESKWGYKSGLTLLLPHGAEGQGPEHSSARLERLLQLGLPGGMRVASPTTAAQVFHLLRRQALDPARRPLMVLTPKSHLRTPVSRSAREEFAGGFLPVIRSGSGRRRLVLAYGKIACDAVQRLPEDVTLLRLEQLLPLPVEEITNAAGGFDDVVLLQEEMENCGVAPVLLPVLKEIGLPVRLVAPELLPSNAPASARWASLVNADLLARALD